MNEKCSVNGSSWALSRVSHVNGEDDGDDDGDDVDVDVDVGGLYLSCDVEGVEDVVACPRFGRCVELLIVFADGFVTPLDACISRGSSMILP